MAIEAIIFDLDGTLVDSANGILASFAGAFQRCNCTPVLPLSHDIIGPPLLPTLRLLAGTEDAAVIDPLAVAFKSYYDESGFRETTVYAGVSALLSRLAHDARPVYIATNKRKRPTDAIIDWLQWGKYFQAVYALDSLQPPASGKDALISHILQTHGLAPERTLYIGDRDDDARAAQQAGTRFFHAAWGYGQQNGNTDDSLQALIELLEIESSP